MGCKIAFDNSLSSNDLSDKIIFSRGSVEEVDKMEIWITDSNGSNQSMLIKKEGDSSLSAPVWSPDGKKIAFTQYFTKYYNDISPYPNKTFSRICVIDYQRGKELILTDDTWHSGRAHWSPDGRKIAFAARRNKDGDYDIYVMDADGRNKEKIPSTSNEDSDPIWSPDGENIVFTSAPDYGSKILDSEYVKTKGNSDIYIVNVDSKKQIKLTDNPTNDVASSWSPDGRKLLYFSRRGNLEIFVIDIDTKSELRLTNNSVDDYNPIWSPDGKKIAYVCDCMLYLMDPDGKNQVKLTDKSQCYVSYGVWSPDSKKIAFVAEPPHPPQNKIFPDDIYIIDIDSKNLKNLTNTPDYWEASPSWRPIAKK